MRLPVDVGADKKRLELVMFTANGPGPWPSEMAQQASVAGPSLAGSSLMEPNLPKQNLPGMGFWEAMGPRFPGETARAPHWSLGAPIVIRRGCSRAF
jgi:hypothetical protein